MLCNEKIKYSPNKAKFKCCVYCLLVLSNELKGNVIWSFLMNRLIFGHSSWYKFAGIKDNGCVLLSSVLPVASFSLRFSMKPNLCCEILRLCFQDFTFPVSSWFSFKPEN